MPFVPRVISASNPSALLHTSARQAFKILTSRIHGQLPLSQRESQQLLELVKTSFRSHLDREHPPDASDTQQKAPQSALPAPPSSRRNSSANSRRTTDEHLQNILTNPLFAIKPRRLSHLTEVSEDSLMTNPLRWFNEEIAMGTATVAKAVTCLRNLANQGYLIPDAAGYSKAKESGAGSKVVDWLNANEKEVLAEFLQNYELAELTTKFMLAEGREDVIWDWIGTAPQAADRLSLDLKTFHNWKTYILNCFIKIRTEEHTDKGLLTFLRALRILAVADPGNRFTPRKASLQVIKHLVTPPEGTTRACSSTLYEDVIKHGTVVAGNQAFFEAFLWLHHPRQPETAFALEFVRQGRDEKLISAKSNSGTTSRNSTDWVEIFYYDLMHRLLENDKKLEAMEILAKLQTRRSPKRSEESKTETRDSHEVNSKGEAESLSYLRAFGLT